jgi:DNA-binding transcriptional MocR family regulator
VNDCSKTGFRPASTLTFVRRGALFSRMTVIRDGEGIRDSVYRQLRDLIMRGSLQPGTRVPSSRTLAADLGVSRNSVSAAFERLIDEALLVSRRGTGCFVAADVPRVSFELVPAVPTHPSRSVELFPLEAWRRCLRSVTKTMVSEDMAAGHDRELCRAIAEHVAASRGIRCRPDQIFIFRSREEAIAATGDDVFIDDFADMLYPIEIAYVIASRPFPACVPVFVQRALALFIFSGEFAAHVRRMRAIEAARREWKPLTRPSATTWAFSPRAGRRCAKRG